MHWDSKKRIIKNKQNIKKIERFGHIAINVEWQFLFFNLLGMFISQFSIKYEPGTDFLLYWDMKSSFITEYKI